MKQHLRQATLRRFRDKLKGEEEEVECILTLPPYRSADIPVRSNVLPANGHQNAAELSFVNCCGQECPRSGGSVKMHPWPVTATFTISFLLSPLSMENNLVKHPLSCSNKI